MPTRMVIRIEWTDVILESVPVALTALWQTPSNDLRNSNVVRLHRRVTRLHCDEPQQLVQFFGQFIGAELTAFT